MFSLSNFTTAGVTPIESVKLSTLIKESGATGLTPTKTRWGTKLFLTKSGKRVQIGDKLVVGVGIGPKAVLPVADLFAEEPKERANALKELINNNIIYHGMSEGVTEKGDKIVRPWMTFSKKGTIVEGTEISFDELLTATGMTKAEFAATI